RTAERSEPPEPAFAKAGAATDSGTSGAGAAATSAAGASEACGCPPGSSRAVTGSEPYVAEGDGGDESGGDVSEACFLPADGGLVAAVATTVANEPVTATRFSRRSSRTSNDSTSLAAPG